MKAFNEFRFLLKNNLANVVIAMALLCANHSVYADTKQEVIDARQETQIWTTYALSPYLRASDLKVTVHNGKATLSGNVGEDVNKELAKQIALGVDGIKEVDNQIVVQEDYKPSGKQGYGEKVDDITINATVRARLIWSKYSYISTNVETNNGRVTLTGSVTSAAAKANAERLASNTRGVRSVSNQIRIDPDKKPLNALNNAADKLKQTAQEAGEKVEDAWITAKVKSNFLYSSNVSGTDIDVDTKDGEVALKGKVSSNAERALAIELAENVRGVKSVNAKALVTD